MNSSSSSVQSTCPCVSLSPEKDQIQLILSLVHVDLFVSGSRVLVRGFSRTLTWSGLRLWSVIGFLQVMTWRTCAWRAASTLPDQIRTDNLMKEQKLFKLSSTILVYFLIQSSRKNYQKRNLSLLISMKYTESLRTVTISSQLRVSLTSLITTGVPV